MVWYFLVLTWFGGYVSGYSTVQVGPFDSEAACQRKADWVVQRKESHDSRIVVSGCWSVAK